MTEPTKSGTATAPESTPEGAGPRAVLVATDFSDTAAAALGWAIEIARPHGATIHLVHGLTLPAALPDYVATATAELGEQLQTAALARLEESAETVRAAGLPAETDLRMGIPSQVILDAAEALDPDLVVLGTSGITGLSHLLLGSTAERVVQRVAQPVLTVHPQDAGRHRPIRTVVVPTDFSEDARQAIDAAHRLLARLERGLKLVLVHAFHLPIEYTAYGPIPTSVHYLQDVGAEAENRLAEVAEGLAAPGLTVATVCREGYAPDVIVAAAAEHNADLIAMGTHGRSGLAHLLLGSTAERVVQRAPCPVITLRRQASD
jgi:nucleotide-binding universal stress UspA family protein